jgi:polysaccharide biosynthesis protein PelF
LFKSFFQGGFECSTHRRKDRRRLDVIAATRHDTLAETDYALLKSVGLRTVRDGVRWHLIETSPGYYDWSSLMPMLQSADRVGTQIIWDLLHYGWPDHIDIWSASFIDSYAAFAAATLKFMQNASPNTPIFVPINEISFTAWAGGQFDVFNPFGLGRGDELKAQLVRAAIAGMEAIWEVDPTIRFAHVEPAINVLPDLNDGKSDALAAAYNNAQFHAWDMLAGLVRPELGGSSRYMDILGINYYCHNQWRVNGGPIEVTNPDAKSFSSMLQENFRRYGRPIFIAETGIEAELRPWWFRHVCAEVKTAVASHVPIHGICLYPVMNHPGWDDDRHCPNGLVDYSTLNFERRFDRPLLLELQRQQVEFKNILQSLQTSEM